MTRIHPLFAPTRAPVLVGMVHLLPLPGAPRFGGSMNAVVEAAVRDAMALAEGGFDAVLVENFGDVPFFPGRVPAETVAALARTVAAVREAVGPLPVGVNVLRNDAASALGIAVATGARFIRVNVHTGTMFTDQGILDGEAHATLRHRMALGAGPSAPPEQQVALVADVQVKHAVPPTRASLEDTARDTWARGLADVLVVSGRGTGAPVHPDRIRRVREAVPEAPLWLGSGLTPETAPELLPQVNGAIVGSALHADGALDREIDLARVRHFVAAARG
jgi:uncharacterized protein